MMGLFDVFFDPEPRYTRREIALIVKGGRSIPGLLLAVLIATLSYFIGEINNVFDALVLAVVLGIGIRFLIRNNDSLIRLFYPGILIAPIIFIPAGLVFYGVKNLDFLEFIRVNPAYIGLEIIVVVVFFVSIIFLGKILKTRRQITYLTATGSGVCGASAIVITSSAVSAEPDDVSVSLISVFIAAVVGLFIIFPVVVHTLGMNNLVYALFSGMTLQFTGFVKLASDMTPEGLAMVISSQEAGMIALSVKAVRYLGLLIAIPLFASMMKRRVYVPWFLWIFLVAGLAGSFIMTGGSNLSKTLAHIVKPVYTFLWATAMAAVGLNADLMVFLSRTGIRCLVMAFGGFFAAIIVFLVGILMIGF